MNLPNKLTLLRICLVPFMAVFFFINYDWCMWAAAAIFIVAAITDIIDGNYARKHDICTDFGRLMDPIADKILTNTAFILVISCGRFQFSELERMILAICVIIFIAREFVISGFRLVAAGKGLVMAAGKLGKAKTTLQCIAAVSLMLGNPVFNLIGLRFDIIVTVIAAILSVVSCVDYLVRNKGVIDMSSK
ncbi:MAG TPA: CDP-diacylglycerol--glycerol-3-phosphate 3-phosphatidyltransferase [Eubacteriales bacterium]|nr:CDP-diacylglycerol--glycerol-3-phosphate 3-phosphatidyltransferase [Clostridia bacterium]HRV72739.1 CDP-diacylglycerol--glycerol-3-phosphate 3-phosphatidyltransferase [Eubacteriales bacterium]